MVTRKTRASSKGDQWTITDEDVAADVRASLPTILELAEVRKALKVNKQAEGTIVDRVKRWFDTNSCTVGSVAGRVVMTCRTSATFQAARFAADRPDLFEQFQREVVVKELDVEALRRAHPEVYRQYLTRVLKLNDAVIEEILSSASSQPGGTF